MPQVTASIQKQIMGRHYPFPLHDRTGERVIHQRTQQEGIIVGHGSCAYSVNMGDAVKVYSTYELDYLDELDTQAIEPKTANYIL